MSRRYELGCDRAPKQRLRARQMRLACDYRPPKPRRWIGLALAAPRGDFFEGAAHAIHASGFATLLFVAAALNFALYPQALAAAVNGAPPPLAATQTLATPAPLAAATTPTTAAIDPEDVHLLAATAWAEARSEGENGMRAVAHVIVNRMGPRFGANLRTVILAPKQFSAWNIGDPNRPLALHPERYAAHGANRATWETAQQVALEVLSGQSADPTNGALFYHTSAVHPVWARYGVGRTVLGAHIFYHDVPDPPARASAPQPVYDPLPTPDATPASAPDLAATIY